MKKYEFSISGMSCAACASHVEHAVQAIPGTSQVSVSLLTNSMSLMYDGDPAVIVEAVHKAGYEASLRDREAPLQFEKPVRRIRPMLLSVCFALPLLWLSMGHMLGLPIPPILNPDRHAALYVTAQWLLCIPVLILQRGYFRRGIAGLIHRAPGMDSLIALGSGVAFIHGTVMMIIIWMTPQAQAAHLAMQIYLEAAAMILTLVSIGKALEGEAKNKTASAIAALGNMIPKTVPVRTPDGNTEMRPTDSLCAGDLIVLRAGERLPVDGVVTEGDGSTDESAITGESLPQDKAVGDPIPAGAVLTSGFLVVRAERVGTDSSLSETIRMIRQAADGKAPIARLADRVSRFFVPAVLLIALLTFVIWIPVADINTALRHAIAVLVISCPCALGLATPTAIMTATGRGAELGILFKSAASLEAMGHVSCIALDKTGTITTGVMTLAEAIPAPGISKEELEKTALSLETPSTHPIAKGVTSAFPHLIPDPVTDFSPIPGKGVYAKINGEMCFAGNAALLEEDCELDLSPLHDDAQRLVQIGCSLLYVSRGERVLGVIGVSDAVRQDSAQAFSDLTHMKIRCVMLTGDQPAVAEAVAKQVGCTDFYAGLLPADKARTVRQLTETEGCVAMVGDGINDAPALTAADVGIAVGAGTDVAIESADAVLRRSTLSDVVTALRLGRATLRNIRENLFWALIYNAICIPIAAGVFAFASFELSPTIAALAMSCSSLSVVLNALRLRRFRAARPSGTAEEKK